jgi:hypothetical protein
LARRPLRTSHSAYLDGHSIGARWDGRTLVINTIGVEADSFGLGLNVPACPRRQVGGRSQWRAQEISTAAEENRGHIPRLETRRAWGRPAPTASC